MVNVSPHQHQGNVTIRLTGEKVQYSYSFRLKKFLCMESVVISPREKNVLRLMKGGYTEEEIAAHMHITVNTVKYHKKNIYKKTGARNMKQAIALARRLAIV
jgi:DNA-binding CsgD family transcriptional regulator